MTDKSKNIINWLSSLIAFDTQNGIGDELACAQWLGEKLAEFDPDTLVVERVRRSKGKSDSGYVFARWGTPKTLLNVHIDTVPVVDGWTYDPFTVSREGRKLIGLGTSDIKGAAACILAALEEVKPHNVAILFSGDEEHGSEVMPEAIKRSGLSAIPKAIVCEPTSCQMGIRHRGILAYRLSFSGPGGHSSLADIMDSPLQDAARFATDIANYGREHMERELSGYRGLCLNVGRITTDGYYNVIPTQAAVDISMRPAPGDDIDRHDEFVKKLATETYGHGKFETLVRLYPLQSRAIESFEPIFPAITQVTLPY